VFIIGPSFIFINSAADTFAHPHRAGKQIPEYGQVPFPQELDGSTGPSKAPTPEPGPPLGFPVSQQNEPKVKIEEEDTIIISVSICN
jgi:hypothetical protein